MTEKSRSEKVEERLARSFERVATTTERVGIPVATFAIGAVAIGISGYYTTKIPILPWVGLALILASLGTYIWLTSRSTIRVQLPPPPIPAELQEQLSWMRDQVEKQNQWMRTLIENKAESRGQQ